MCIAPPLFVPYIAPLYLYHTLPPFICTRSGGCLWQVLSLLNWLKYITGEILYGWCEVLAKDFLSFQMCTFIFFSCPVGWLFIGSDDSQLFWSQSLNNFWLWHLKHLRKMSPSFLTRTSFFCLPGGMVAHGKVPTVMDCSQSGYGDLAEKWVGMLVQQAIPKWCGCHCNLSWSELVYIFSWQMLLYVPEKS